jgi:GntR family transcriptional regulator
LQGCLPPNSITCPVNRMTGTRDFTPSRGERPIYVRLAEHIADGIRSGELLPGDRVASEPELMRRHGISRATAVKALEHLEHRGLVRRQQGRGTFVEAPRLVQRSAQLGSFSEQVRRHGHTPSQRLLSIGTPHRSTDDLGLRARLGEDIVEIQRLRLVDGEPVGVHTTALERRVAQRADLTEGSFADEQASLYTLLGAAGIHVAEADEHLQAVEATEKEAELLGIEPGSALMRVVRISYGADGEPIEVVDARYRADRFDYSVSLVRQGRAGGESSRGKGKEHHEGQFNEGARDARRGRGDGGRVRQVGRRELE